jgi:hypothetical protein
MQCCIYLRYPREQIPCQEKPVTDLIIYSSASHQEVLRKFAHTISYSIADFSLNLTKKPPILHISLSLLRLQYKNLNNMVIKIMTATIIILFLIFMVVLLRKNKHHDDPESDLEEQLLTLSGESDDDTKQNERGAAVVLIENSYRDSESDSDGDEYTF